ncbi:hypothetical protein BHM03_00042777 [Ensete ventricosum]|nr:hypothetical protein BHM03_00042777 [Ensete ventricosum]
MRATSLLQYLIHHYPSAVKGVVGWSVYRIRSIMLPAVRGFIGWTTRRVCFVMPSATLLGTLRIDRDSGSSSLPYRDRVDIRPMSDEQLKDDALNRPESLRSVKTGKNNPREKEKTRPTTTGVYNFEIRCQKAERKMRLSSSLSSSIRCLFLMAAVAALLFTRFQSAYGGAQACMIRSGLHAHGFVLRDPSLPSFPCREEGEDVGWKGWVESPISSNESCEASNPP